MLTRQKQTNKQKSEIKIKILGKVYVSICYYQEIYQFFSWRVRQKCTLTHPHSQMCIKLYIFLFQTKKHIHKQRNKKQKKLKKIEKQKTLKEKKRKKMLLFLLAINAEILTRYDDIV